MHIKLCEIIFFYAPAIFNAEGGGGAYSITAVRTSVRPSRQFRT